jgi:DNA-binding response OmpR family regulator
MTEKATAQLILVVEDDKPISQLMQEILEDEGYSVLAAYNVEGALTYLKTIRPTLIMLDVNLPDINGATFLLMIRSNAEYKDIPIIITSAHSELEFEVKRLAQGVLYKPFDIDELLSTVAAEIMPAQLMFGAADLIVRAAPSFTADCPTN